MKVGTEGVRVHRILGGGPHVGSGRGEKKKEGGGKKENKPVMPSTTRRERGRRRGEEWKVEGERDDPASIRAT